MKKAKRPSSIRTDDSRPSKPAVPPPSRGEAGEAGVEIPTYRGPTKTDKAAAPKQARRADRVKAPFERKTVRRRRSGSKEV